jgi:hypothetical protein
VEPQKLLNRWILIVRQDRSIHARCPSQRQRSNTVKPPARSTPNSKINARNPPKLPNAIHDPCHNWQPRPRLLQTTTSPTSAPQPIRLSCRHGQPARPTRIAHQHERRSFQLRSPASYFQRNYQPQHGAVDRACARGAGARSDKEYEFCCVGW